MQGDVLALSSAAALMLNLTGGMLFESSVLCNVCDARYTRAYACTLCSLVRAVV